MRTGRTVISLLIGLVLLVIGCRQRVQLTPRSYYVAVTGDDSNPGTMEAPFRSPGYGAAQMHSGDTLVILSGRYVLDSYEDIIIPPSGDSELWTVVRGEGPTRPVLAGREDLICAISLSGRQYVEVSGLEITSDSGALFRQGIDLTPAPASFVLLSDLHIHHLDEFGINAGDVQWLEISHSKITHCGFGAIGGPAGYRGGWCNVLIYGCTLSYSGHYYQGGPGPSPYSRPDGFGIEASDGPVEIANTVVEHNRGDGIDSKAKNTWVHECVIANNSCDGVKFWAAAKLENSLIYGRGDGDTTTTPWAAIVIDAGRAGQSFSITNVTVDDSLGKNYLLYVQYDNNLKTYLNLTNNILSGRGPNSPIYLGSRVQPVFRHNLFYLPRNQIVLQHGSRLYPSDSLHLLGPGNIYGDPRFLATGFGTTGNYHLDVASPAIDAGTGDSVPEIDLEGRNRPIGSGYDIGCYEQ